MNPFNAITFAALCGPLAQPAAMAMDFIPQPAPIMAEVDNGSLLVESFSRAIEEGKKATESLNKSIDDYYVMLVETDSGTARHCVLENGVEMIEACEMFLRGFEEETKRTLSNADIPDFVISELRVYWRYIARARSSATRLNTFAKSLLKNAETFESGTDLFAVKELASMTTGKMKEINFH